MKRFILFLALVSLFLSGCKSNSKPGIEGYVIKKEDRGMLVVASVPKDFSSTGGLKEFYNAIWFSNAPKKVQVGQRVQVWFDLVMESYPGQAKATKISILPSKKPKGANLTEAAAIRKALESPEISPQSVPAIKKGTYDHKSDVWNIVIIQSETEIKVQIEDK